MGNSWSTFGPVDRYRRRKTWRKQLRYERNQRIDKELEHSDRVAGVYKQKNSQKI